jgi:hypothetical protein
MGLEGRGEGRFLYAGGIFVERMGGNVEIARRPDSTFNFSLRRKFKEMILFYGCAF